MLGRDDRYRSLHSRSDGMCGKERVFFPKHCVILQRSLKGLNECEGELHVQSVKINTWRSFLGALFDLNEEELSELTLVSQLVCSFN